FQPDIVYRLDDPGISAVECVVPAVEKVLESGMVDRNKIGLMGHSWGAYQTAFIVTQTDLFSAAVAGAPLTDMISMYTEVYWNSGGPNQNIFETSQGRFTQPYWKIMDKYIANSPMFQAQNITAPILVTFGDQDGAVDWHQGIELYTTMRRMQKPMVLLVYAGENHGLRKEENRKDYTRRINEWFNHYLLGKPAPDWITKGVSYKDKMKKEEAQKGKK
ncbi:MAG: prolyl oligopeptidase family serine peptidase, partial [Bacteroidales bacterium]|nr:prolyl oligopeptidase family serine peptidase [Bacteroidales bacterium]